MMKFNPCLFFQPSNLKIFRPSTFSFKNISTLHLFFQPPFSFNPTSYFNLPPPKYLALHLDNSITAIHTTQTPRLPYSRAMRPKFLLSHGIVKQKQPLD